MTTEQTFLWPELGRVYGVGSHSWNGTAGSFPVITVQVGRVGKRGEKRTVFQRMYWF